MYTYLIMLIDSKVNHASEGDKLMANKGDYYYEANTGGVSKAIERMGNTNQVRAAGVLARLQAKLKALVKQKEEIEDEIRTVIDCIDEEIQDEVR